MPRERRNNHSLKELAENLRPIIVDENIPKDVREWLSKNGFDIVNVSEIHLRSGKDYAIAEYAARNGIAVITLDKDFALMYHMFQKGTLTIIIIRAKPATPANIIETLTAAQKRINLKEIRNKLVIITKKRIRIIS
jgi:predicted nuclease of predicted toxin-antitoxin system